MKTRLDLLLDTVRYAERELTIDVEGYTAEDKRMVEVAALSRGFDVAGDGRHLLIRELTPQTAGEVSGDA